MGRVKFSGVLVAILTLSAVVQARDGVTLFATGPNPGEARDIAILHLVGERVARGFRAEDLDDHRIDGSYTSARSGTTHVHVQQRLGGLDIFGAVANVNVAKDGSVISSANRFVRKGGVAARIQAPKLNSDRALRAALEHLGIQVKPLPPVLQRGGGDDQLVVYDKGKLSLNDIPVRLLYQPMAKQGLRLAWSVEIYEQGAQHWWNLRIDAETGKVLGAHDYVIHDSFDRPRKAGDAAASPADVPQASKLLTGDQYRVFEMPVESPSHGGRSLAMDPADAVASPFGWHDTDGSAGPESTHTIGNNVDAYQDADNSNVPTGGDADRADGGTNLHFDFGLNLAQEPSFYKDAAVVNLFYWNNVIHDVFYRYGFDEAAGNFQDNNYGNGGLGGDRVLAEAQDGGAVNNANFATPGDGSSGRMQMYLWDAPTPDRDGDFDNGIVIHEYGHGISVRLTGGAGNSFCLDNAEQMGEGWSDWFALMLTLETGDTGPDKRGVGTYALDEPVDGNGIRAFPYSTSLAIDPRTYSDISSAAIPHGVGSIWCAMLWEMTWVLMDEHGFDTDFHTGTGGNNIALQLVVEGLKLQPCSPGFVDGRDAILLADQTLNGGANQCLIWEAFAKRGLGFSASQGSSANAGDGIEAFDLPPLCLLTLKIDKSASTNELPIGQMMTYTLQVVNDTTSTLHNVTITDPVPQGSSYVPGSASDGGTSFVGVVGYPAVTLTNGQQITRTFKIIFTGNDFTTVSFSDDMENGGSGWSATHALGPLDWGLTTANAHSPSSSWFAVDHDSPSDQYLQMTGEVAVTAGTLMSFWHSYDTEAGWDGGLVEISTDGSTWLDLGAAMVQNGYSGSLIGGPGAGRSAFTGSSSGFVETRANLSGFLGQTVQVRFRLSTDASVGGVGWYVDDVSFISEVLITNVASVVAAEGDSASDRVATRVLESTEPSFFVHAIPPLIEICSSADAIVTVMVDTVYGFTNAVTLSVTGHPPGSVAILNPVIVDPTPGTALLVISNLGGVAAGNYLLEVTGIGPSTTRVDSVQFNVTTTAPGVAELLAPTNGAFALILSPTLMWGASTDADVYHLEIDDDPAFGSIDYSATVASTSHTVSTSLSIETEYAWRVRSENPCGVTFSTSFVFETESPPTILVSPPSLSTTQDVGSVIVRTLTISNLSSTSTLTWDLEEGSPFAPFSSVVAKGPAVGATSLSSVPRVEMPAVDHAAQFSADAAALGPDKVLRFAESLAVELTPDNSGKWEKLANGNLLWRLRIKSADAISLNLGFSRYKMPPGGSLMLYAADGGHLRGPFTDADNERHGQLWTPIVEGDEVVIEVQLPALMPLGLELTLSSVNHAYRDISASANLSGSCNVDVVCGDADGLAQVDAWRSEIRSVAAYSTGGSLLCSGGLLNNTAQDLKPLFLTANHCGITSGNAASMVVYWNYENSTCRTPGSPESGGAGDGSLSQFSSGAIFRSASAASDFTLVELDDPIDPGFNVHWAGWDASGAESPVAIAIHHPNTDEKRISFEDAPTTTTAYLADVVPGDGSHVRVADWDLGTTEPGSSGSPLFDSNRRVIGQLHGGFAACGNELSDWYGRLNVSWTGGGSAATRLADWLDPLALGGTTLSGRDATAPNFTWVSASPTNGSTGPSATTAIAVTFDATGVSPGLYTASLRILSNDPSTPEVSVPRSMLVRGFEIDFAPPTLHACTNENAVFDIDLDSLNGFTGTVQLAVSGLPIGAEASFDNNPIDVSGFSVHPTDGHLTISNLSAVAAGEYPLIVSGVDLSSTATGSTTVVLSLLDAAPAGITLVSPVAGASSVTLATTYRWEVAGEATSYLLEVDDDPAFSSLDYSITVAETNHTSSNVLNSAQSYFWRVTAHNACGSLVSTSQTFSTELPAITTCSSPALAIPDNNGTGVSDSLSVSNGGEIIDINVSVNISHTWVGDLIVSLEHEASGTSVTIIDRPGRVISGAGCGFNNIIATLDDEASSPVEDECAGSTPTIVGSFTPNNALSAFDGLSVNGTWTLTVSDVEGLDVGTLNDWCLIYTVYPAQPPEILVQPGALATTQATEMVLIKTLDIENLSEDSTLNWTIGESAVEESAYAKHDDVTNHVPCVDGFAGAFPCNNVDLLGFLPLDDIGGGDGSDIWGWTDSLTGKEYAIMGRTTGTAFVDISDAEEPVYLGNLPSHIAGSYAWRDIKTYSNHAYIVCDHSSTLEHGMQVFDLTELRTVVSPPVVFGETAHYTNFGRAHNIVINEDSGYAYAVGVRGPGVTCGNGLHMINIQNPTNPVFAGCFSADGYTHDAQCVTYHGPDSSYAGSELCFNANEDTLTIVDVSNKGAPVQLSRTGYTGEGYTHQGWLTEDHRHFLLDDELDEFQHGHNTRTYIWDVSDLTNPVVIATYTAPTAAIDHNQFVKGDLVYQANYRAGLRILDGSDVANGNLSEIGYFDIYPPDDNGCSSCFNGAWGNYPYFDSGVVIISGLEFNSSLVTQGLYIVQPTFAPEPCEALEDVPWLSLVPGSGATAPGSTSQVDVVFDATGLGVGAYSASLCISSDDPSTPNVVVRLHMTVVPGVLLNVVSDFDKVTPGVGQHAFVNGTPLSPSVDDPVFTNGLSQYVIMGWTGSGSVPSSGVGTNIGTFAITTNSVVTWHWDTNFWLNTEAVGPGVVDVPDGFYPSGVSTTITGHAVQYYHLGQWTGDTNDALIAGNVLMVAMDMPRAISGHFVENLAPLGTPEWWLALHALTFGGFAFQELLDVDGDGHAAWQEYVADTVPTNMADALKILATIVSNTNDQVVLEWSSKSGRTYAVDRATNLFVNLSGIASNLVATPPANSYTDVSATNSTSYHYQIRVE